MNLLSQIDRHHESIDIPKKQKFNPQIIWISFRINPKCKCNFGKYSKLNHY